MLVLPLPKRESRCRPISLGLPLSFAVSHGSFRAMVTPGPGCRPRQQGSGDVLMMVVRYYGRRTELSPKGL